MPAADSDGGRHIAWVGLGDQGTAIVRRLLTSDHAVSAWARRPASFEPFQHTRLRHASTLTELAGEADYLGICVRDEADVREVMVTSGLLDNLRPGTTVAIHSTVRPEFCRWLDELLRARGISMIDAPVSRNSTTHEAARLTLLVGGDQVVVQRVRVILDALGDHWYHLGPVGSAQAAKLINNTLGAAHLGLIFEALDAAEAMSVDPELLLTILSESSGGSTMLRFVPFYRPEVRPDYLGLMDKDLKYFRQLVEGDGQGVAGRLVEVAAGTVERLKASAGQAG